MTERHDPTGIPPVDGRASRRSRQWLLVLCAVPLAGVLTAGCNASSSPRAAHAPPAKAAVTSTNARTSTSTSTTVPACGATRDPFDSTDSAAPAGSPAAHC